MIIITQESHIQPRLIKLLLENPFSSPSAVAFLAASALRQAKIYVDNEFVSDAMFGFVGAEPIFHLPFGVHTFRVESEGYKTYRSDIKVLAGGCVQYLVVVMHPAKHEPDAAAKAILTAPSAASR